MKLDQLLALFPGNGVSSLDWPGQTLPLNEILVTSQQRLHKSSDRKAKKPHHDRTGNTTRAEVVVRERDEALDVRIPRVSQLTSRGPSRGITH